MNEEFKNKKILITGGCGSVGISLIKELLKFEPKVIRILDSNENALFNLEQELGDDKLRFLLGSVRDKERLIRATEDIDIIFHTAALKHVSIGEYNPFEVLKTNVIGTQNVIDAAIKNRVKKVIFTSSDKAVNPTNAMGASKLLAEKLIVAANYYRGKAKTIFSSVRFGNILGSQGSVLPLFKKQILENKKVTITHKDMTRFILTMRETMDFLLKAITLAKGGEVFVPKMRVMRVTDLAEVLIERYSKSENIEIEYIGIKTGEKLYEEIMSEHELRYCLELEDMYVILPQIKELCKVDEKDYPNAKKVDKIPLASKDIKPISKGKLKELLIKERLI